MCDQKQLDVSKLKAGDHVLVEMKVVEVRQTGGVQVQPKHYCSASSAVTVFSEDVKSIVERPLKVGDTVRVDNGSTVRELLMIDGDFAWTKVKDRTGDTHTTYRLRDLVRVK